MADLAIRTECIFVTGYRLVLAHSINTVVVVVTIQTVVALLRWGSGGSGGGWRIGLTHAINAVIIPSALLGHEVITIRVITATVIGATEVGFISNIIMADLGLIITEWINVTGYRVVLAQSFNTVEVVVTFRAVFANLKWGSGGSGGGSGGG